MEKGQDDRADVLPGHINVTDSEYHGELELPGVGT
jgi:hypothetical protein